VTSIELVKDPSAARDLTQGHKLWGGRFATGTSSLMDAVNRSIGVDFRLWPYDVKLSKAWCVALWGAGVLTLEESKELERGLDTVGEHLASGAAPLPSDEDVHSMIDRMLHEVVGEVASKLHTGRSRNDQVATATRMWTIEACARLDAAIRTLQGTILGKAESLLDSTMPSYTHLQRAQPVSGAHWMLSHFWPLDRDRTRLGVAARAASTLPLGSGAVAGCAFPISRTLLQGSLGFAATSRNSMDAVADRDFVAEVLFVIALVAVHISRLAEDLILFGSSEFGFVRFGDAFSTGSSMMPQKRNPDALEIARGSASRVLGDLTSLLGSLKGLPSGYNKDLQDDKRALFDAVDASLLVIPAVDGTVREVEFDRARMAAAVSSTMMATDLADHLVRRGVAFREAHSAVGRLVRESEDTGIDLAELPVSSFLAAHPGFGEDFRSALAVRASIERRNVDGGTGSSAVVEQLELARRSLQPPPERRANEFAVRGD
jgi:argininosuccinate lyase